MRITFNDVKTSLNVTESYDIINAIRNSGSEMMQKYIPLANANNIAQIGAGLTMNQTVANEFITSLVERIAVVVLRKVTLNNPLKVFKKGQIPMGRTIEEIFVDIAKEHKYDPETAESEVFKREIPNVKTLFHDRNREGFYKQTIQDSSLTGAFTNTSTFENFISGIVNAMYNAAEVDEYYYTKLLIDNYYSKGLFKVEKVSKVVGSTTASDFIKKVRGVAKKMTLPVGTRKYNSLAVHTRSEMEDLHLFIDADLEAEVDVEVLARAFNMEKTNFMGNVTVIDGFASTGLQAVLVDKSFFMIYDNLHKMETQRNSQGLYWNYFYHIWQTYSVSRFANAVAFTIDENAPTVTQVIVDPSIAAIKAGRTLQFNSYQRSLDDQTRAVTWSVVAATGSTLAAGTTVSNTGLLTLGAAQTGEVIVKARVNYTQNTVAKNTEGQAIISVIA